MDLQVEDLLSSNAVHAIDFDTPEQIHGLIGQLGANINNQVKQASASLNAPEVEQLNALLHEQILTRLSQLIQMNTSVKGGSWSDLQERRREAKQPLDAALLRETIATQDSAFTFSSANAAQRTEKAPLFVEQVDKHVRQVYTSQSREHAMLRRQNLDRTASIQTSGEELALPEDLSVALLRIDATLNTTSALVSGLCQRAGTAVSAAADVVSIQRSVP